jgi:hypothetical protein
VWSCLLWACKALWKLCIFIRTTDAAHLDVWAGGWLIWARDLGSYRALPYRLNTRVLPFWASRCGSLSGDLPIQNTIQAGKQFDWQSRRNEEVKFSGIIRQGWMCWKILWVWWCISARLLATMCMLFRTPYYSYSWPCLLTEFFARGYCPGRRTQIGQDLSFGPFRDFCPCSTIGPLIPHSLL